MKNHEHPYPDHYPAEEAEAHYAGHPIHRQAEGFAQAVSERWDRGLPKRPYMPIQLKLAIAAVLLALSFWAGWEWRDRSADVATATRNTSDARTEVKAQSDARATETQQASALANIGDTHEQDREAAKAVPDAVVADLRAGTLKLRNDLATCHTRRLSEAAAGAVQRDATAELRADIAGAIVRAGRDADDQLRACQAVVSADRE